MARFLIAKLALSPGPTPGAPLVALGAAALLLVSGCGPSPAAGAPFTCAPPSGTLAAEAGFIEVPKAVAGRTSRHFYAFRPASREPASSPLVLFFNGGPLVTSMILAALHTGAQTLDPGLAGELGRIGDNATPWTSFANLLYVDARQTGFSYDLDDGPPPPMEPPAPNTPRYDDLMDGRAFLLVLLRFFDRRPELRCNPVILVGESYGGYRATVMLSLLYGSRADAGAEVEAALAAHFGALLPGHRGIPDAASVRRQFGWQVLIQPLVTSRQPAMPARGTPPALVTAVEGGLQDAVTKAMESAESMTRILGVDPRGIALMQPAARTRAAKRSAGGAEPEPLAAVLGKLAPGDRYFAYASSGLESWRRADLASRFADNLRWVDTLITDAAWDTQISEAFVADNLMVEAPAVRRAQVEGEGSGRRISVSYADGATRAISFPRYERSGHVVSATEPQALLADALRLFRARAP